MTGVFFPTKYEADEFLNTLNGVVRSDIGGVEVYLASFREKKVLVAIIGMGPTVSAARAKKVLQGVELINVIMAGFAGALNPNLTRGQVLIANGYTTDDDIAYLKAIPDFDIAELYTSRDLVGTAEQKQQIRKDSGCQMVDMETEAVAEVVNQYPVSFLGVRAISDLSDEDLPVEVLKRGYDCQKGKVTPIRLCFYLLFHPFQIPAFRGFLAPLPQVRAALTKFLLSAVADL